MSLRRLNPFRRKPEDSVLLTLLATTPEAKLSQVTESSTQTDPSDAQTLGLNVVAEGNQPVVE